MSENQPYPTIAYNPSGRKRFESQAEIDAHPDEWYDNPDRKRGKPLSTPVLPEPEVATHDSEGNAIPRRGAGVEVNMGSVIAIHESEGVPDSIVAGNIEHPELPAEDPEGEFIAGDEDIPPDEREVAEPTDLSRYKVSRMRVDELKALLHDRYDVTVPEGATRKEMLTEVYRIMDL